MKLFLKMLSNDQFSNLFRKYYMLAHKWDAFGEGYFSRLFTDEQSRRFDEAI